MEENQIIIAVAGVGLLALACQTLAWRLNLPAILFLLLAGMLIGPVAHWVDPAALFGDLLFPFISLSVAVILFEGSLTLKLEEIRGMEAVVRRLVTVGLLTTWIVTAVGAHWIVALPWPLAFLFGAITVVTGPTVIAPMLRTVRPTARIANVLRWEGIIIDPIGALLAVLVFEFIVSGRGDTAFGHTLFVFGKTVVTGAALGMACGYLLGQVLRRHLLPEYLHNLATLALLFGVYAVSDVIADESGLLAVTVLGLWLTNMKGVNIDQILGFKESLSLLLISVLFIILAARIDFAEFMPLNWTALGMLAVIQLVARPLKVAVSSWGSELNWRERALLAWIAPRGIVAAAVAAVFALRLQGQGLEQAAVLVPLTFMVILGTVLLQSATARPLAVALKVGEPEPRGFLIIGANAVARAIGKTLQEHNHPVVLSDTNWDDISTARMEGLKTFFGNPVSEFADRHLDLIGIGRLLALSRYDDVNALATLRYRPEFGQEAVFSLAPHGSKGEPETRKTAIRKFGRVLFGEDVDYARLAGMLARGAELRGTPLTEKFGLDELRREYGADALLLFALTPRGRLHVFTPEADFKPAAGWTVISISCRDTSVKKAVEHHASDGGPRSV